MNLERARRTIRPAGSAPMGDCQLVLLRPLYPFGTTTGEKGADGAAQPTLRRRHIPSFFFSLSRRIRLGDNYLVQL